MASSWMDNPTDQDWLLFKTTLILPFPVWGLQPKLDVRAASRLLRAAGGAPFPIRWISQMVFLSNWALGAMPTQQQKQQCGTFRNYLGPIRMPGYSFCLIYRFPTKVGEFPFNPNINFFKTSKYLNVYLRCAHWRHAENESYSTLPTGRFSEEDEKEEE